MWASRYGSEGKIKLRSSLKISHGRYWTARVPLRKIPSAGVSIYWVGSSSLGKGWPTANQRSWQCSMLRSTL